MLLRSYKRLLSSASTSAITTAALLGFLLIGGTSTAFAAASSTAKMQSAQGNYSIYSAGYSGIIQHLTFVPPSGKTGNVGALVPGSAIAANSSGTSPSWLAFRPASGSSGHKHDHGEHGHGHRNFNVIYSVDESVPGKVYAHKVVYSQDGTSSTLEKIGTPAQIANGTSSGGDGPVALSFSGGKHGVGAETLWVANYNTGTVGALPIESDGTLLSTSSSTPGASKTFQFTRPADGPPVGPVTSRQDHSYAHQVVTGPDGRFVYVPDLGADQVHVIAVSEKSKTQEDAKVVQNYTVQAGSGPRHIAFYPPKTSGKRGEKVYAYLACELTSSLIGFEVDSTTGKLSPLPKSGKGSGLVAVPPGTPLGGNATAGPQRTVAEVAVSPDGRYIYVSNRGDDVEDHISIFERSTTTGEVESWREWVASGGRNPRHFSVSGDAEAKYLAVGHQITNNTVVFERDATTGSLNRVDGAELMIQGVSGIAFTGFAPF